MQLHIVINIDGMDFQSLQRTDTSFVKLADFAFVIDVIDIVHCRFLKYRSVLKQLL